MLLRCERCRSNSVFSFYYFSALFDTNWKYDGAFQQLMTQVVEDVMRNTCSYNDEAEPVSFVSSYLLASMLRNARLKVRKQCTPSSRRDEKIYSCYSTPSTLFLGAELHLSVNGTQISPFFF